MIDLSGSFIPTIPGDEGQGFLSPSEMMKKNFRDYLSTIFIVFAMAVAMAAETSAFEPGSLSFGSFEIHPSLEVEETYNSNIFLMAENEEDDFISILSPGIDLTWGRVDHAYRTHIPAAPLSLSRSYLIDLIYQAVLYPADRGYLRPSKRPIAAGMTGRDLILRTFQFRRYNVALNYEADVIRLADHSTYGATDHAASAIIDCKLPSGWILHAENQYVTTTGVASYRKDIVNYNSAMRMRGIDFSQDAFSTVLGYVFFDQYMLMADYLYYFYDFDDSWDTGIDGVEAGDLGMDIHAFGLTCSTTRFNETTISAQYHAGFVDGNLKKITYRDPFFGIEILRLDRDPRESTYHHFGVGAQRLLTPKMRIAGSVAYEIRQYREGAIYYFNLFDLELEELELRDFGEWMFDFSVFAQIPPFYSVACSVQRRPRQLDASTGLLYIQNKVSLSGRHSWRERLQTGLDLFYERDEYYVEVGNIDRTDEDQYGLGLTFRYDIQDWLNATFKTYLATRKSRAAWSEYETIRLSLSIQAVF